MRNDRNGREHRAEGSRRLIRAVGMVKTLLSFAQAPALPAKALSRALRIFRALPWSIGGDDRDRNIARKLPLLWNLARTSSIRMESKLIYIKVLPLCFSAARRARMALAPSVMRCSRNRESRENLNKNSFWVKFTVERVCYHPARIRDRTVRSDSWN